MKIKSVMIEVEEILKSNKFILRIIGFWPSDNFNDYTLSRLKGFIALFFILLGTSFVIFIQITLIDDTIVFIELIKNVYLIISHIVKLNDPSFHCFICSWKSTDRSLVNVVGWSLMLSKCLSFNLKRDTILSLLVKMERGKMADHWLARREMATKFLTVGYLILTITYIISPLYLSGRNLPFQGNFPSIFFQNPWYQLIYVSEIILTLLAVTNTLACDVVLILFVCQLCNDLHRTAILLQQYGDDECSLRDVINQHISSLNYGETVCRALSVMVFSQNCICSMTICLAFYIIFTVENRLSLLKMSVVLLSMIPLLFINCYGGEMIYSASLSVNRAIDANCWKSGNIKVSKDGAFVVQRAQKPIQMAVGTFAVINLKFFCDSIYNAITYAMILKTIS